MASAFARVIDIRIGHGRVFAHHVHAANLALLGGVHDLDDREARIRIERRAPQLLEPLARLGRVHPLIVGIEHRNQARVRRALHVVLTAQRMQTRARLADLAGRERQGDQAARVVGAVDVLRNAHAPEDDRRARRRVEPGDLADRLRVDAADRRHRFRRELLHVLRQRLVAGRAVANERFVDQALFDDDVEHGVEQRDVGVGIELQVVGGVPGQVAAARVGDDQLRLPPWPRSSSTWRRPDDSPSGSRRSGTSLPRSRRHAPGSTPRPS